MRYFKYFGSVILLVGCIVTFISYRDLVKFSVHDALAKINIFPTAENTLLVLIRNESSVSTLHRLLINRNGSSAVNFMRGSKTITTPTEILSSLYMKKHGVVNSINSTKTNDHLDTTKASALDGHLLTRNYINVNFQGRLGNHVFQFASLYGISRHQRLIPIINNFYLRRIFNISLSTLNNINNVKTYNEHRGCVFENEAFNVDNNFNWTLNGFFQSWKYFTKYSHEIKTQLSFRPSIHNEAKKQFKEILAVCNITFTIQTTFVAVHVRRGDMANSKHMINYGYTSADVSYINRAMLSFRANYSNIVFLISSDDIPWCRQNIKGKNVAFVVNKNPPEIDMAVLTHCNHSIITTGSFGWWIAWLIGGKTIYYKDYPKPKSELSKLFNSDDYRPPDWIPM